MKLLTKVRGNHGRKNDQVVGIRQLDEITSCVAGTCLLVNRGGLILAVRLFRLVAVAKGTVGWSGNLLLIRPGPSAGLLIGKMERMESNGIK